jgi:hypothetical protein
MLVQARGKATGTRAETKRCDAQILQLYRQLAASMGAGIQHVFVPFNHESLSQLSETFNAKLRRGWWDARETTKETSEGKKYDVNIVLLTQKFRQFFLSEAI